MQIPLMLAVANARVAKAIADRADGSRDAVRDHQASWGNHRQGGFRDPFGHIRLVEDRTPLQSVPRGGGTRT